MGGRHAPDAARLRSRSWPRGARATVRFVPRFVADPEMPAYFRRADLVVLPYREIEQSGVLYTALAVRQADPRHRRRGLRRGRGARALRLVPPGDPAALATALSELLADPAERAALERRAAAAAAGCYSWDAIAERTLAVYRGLLGG